jgi:AhpD family alkylhydroperoxidase
MTSRLNPFGTRLDLAKPLIDFASSAQSGLDPVLAELIKIRASQINGCAVCLAMHAGDARRHGESEERIIMLDAWRESPLYSERERAALAWTEVLTRVHERGAPDAEYDALKASFTDEEQIRITLVIGAINAFNRINVGFRVKAPGAAAARTAA